MTVTPNPFDNGVAPTYYIPDAEFQKTPQLQVIYNRGRFNMCSSPTGVYGVALANAAAHIRPGILTPLGHEPNLCVGVHARHSGEGKTTTLRVGRSVVPLDGYGHGMGTWQGFARDLAEDQRWSVARGKRKFPALDFTLDEGGSLYNVLFSRGAEAQAQFMRMLDSGEIVHRKYGVPEGSYRVTVRESIYDACVSGWLFTPRAVAERLTTRFLFVYARLMDKDRIPTFDEYRAYSDTPEAERQLPMPDWSAVPDGPLHFPPSSHAAAERYYRTDTSAFDKDMIRLRFIVATAHAALHCRTYITDADWEWTAYPMEVSRSLASMLFTRAQDIWTWRGRTPKRRKTL